MATNDPLALGAVAAYCGWDPTVVTSATTVLDGIGTDTVFLPTLHLTAVASVIVTLDDAGTTYDATDEVDFGDDGSVTLHSVRLPFFPERKNSIEVQWTGGYATIPADLQAAISSVSARLTSNPGVDTAKIGTASVKFGSTTSEGGFLLVEQFILDSYRIVRSA